jgi:hypothetical protein
MNILGTSIIGITALALVAGVFSSKNLHTEIDIGATPQEVWGHLIDFETYPNWNPFIKTISGELVVGSKLNASLQLPDKGAMTFKPTVLVANTNQEFRWKGKLLLPRIFDGEHYFIIEEKADGTSRFIQGETFKGILVHLIWPLIGKDTTNGFNAMNQALKVLAEK